MMTRYSGVFIAGGQFIPRRITARAGGGRVKGEVGLDAFHSSPFTFHSSTLPAGPVQHVGIEAVPQVHATLLGAGHGLPVRRRRALAHRDGATGDLVVDAPGKVARRIVALELHEVVAGPDLDEQGQIAAGGDWKPDVRLRHAQQVEGLAGDPEAIVFRSLHPLLQFHHQLHALDVLGRSNSDQFLYVDDPDPAQLHVVAEEIVRVPEQYVVGVAFDDHHVVGAEAVTP